MNNVNHVKLNPEENKDLSSVSLRVQLLVLPSGPKSLQWSKDTSSGTVGHIITDDLSPGAEVFEHDPSSLPPFQPFSSAFVPSTV